MDSFDKLSYINNVKNVNNINYVNSDINNEILGIYELISNNNIREMNTKKEHTSHSSKKKKNMCSHKDCKKKLPLVPFVCKCQKMCVIFIFLTCIISQIK